METGSEDGQSRVSGKAREVCLRDAPSSAEEGRNAGQVLTFVVTGYGERSGDADQAFVELKRSWIRERLAREMTSRPVSSGSETPSRLNI